MGNAWVFPSISHDTGKCNKTHCTRRTWKVGTHTFLMVWLLFSHPFPVLWYASTYEKYMYFPNNLQQHRKCNKTYCIGRNWEIGTHTFPIVWALFFFPIPILRYASPYGKCMGFLINFPQHGKMQQNPLHGENLGSWYSYFSHSMGTSNGKKAPTPWEKYEYQFPRFSRCNGFCCIFLEWGKPENLVSMQFSQITVKTYINCC